MTDQEFIELQKLIEHHLLEVEALQKIYRAETGRDFVMGQGLRKGVDHED